MIFQGDAVLKTVVEMAIQDLRDNPWLIDDIFSQFTNNPHLKVKFSKEIENCKEWFRNNQINVYMSHIDTKEQFPAITIHVGDSVESIENARLGDLDVETVELDPESIGRTISYIVKPFIPVSYNSSTGTIVAPSGVNLKYAKKGMTLVNPETGESVEILNIKSSKTLQIAKDLNFDFEQLGILPRYKLFDARRETAAFKETYHIGCHAHGKVSELMWLWSIVSYGLMRYRQDLLEADDFCISSLKSSEIIKNKAFETDKVFSRFIDISGLVQNSWLKAPRKRVEGVLLNDSEADLASSDPDSFVGGVKVIGPDGDNEDNNGLWDMSGQDN
jgi:hypothetical protein